MTEYEKLLAVHTHLGLRIRALGLFVPHLTAAFNARAYVEAELVAKYGSLAKVPDNAGVSFGPRGKYEWKWSYYRDLLAELDRSLAAGEFATVIPGDTKKSAEPHPLAATVIRRIVVGPAPQSVRDEWEVDDVDIEAQLRADLQEAFAYGTAPKSGPVLLSRLLYGTPQRYSVGEWTVPGASSSAKKPSTPVIAGGVAVILFVVAAIAAK